MTTEERPFDAELARKVLIDHQRVSADSCATCGRIPIGSCFAEHIIDEYHKAVEAKHAPKPKWWAERSVRNDCKGQWLLRGPGYRGWVARTDMWDQTEAQALMERIAELLNRDEGPKPASLTEAAIRSILVGTLPVHTSATNSDIAIAARRIHKRLSQ